MDSTIDTGIYILNKLPGKALKAVKHHPLIGSYKAKLANPKQLKSQQRLLS
jgi:hypothetical protein